MAKPDALVAFLTVRALASALLAILAGCLGGSSPLSTAPSDSEDLSRSVAAWDFSGRNGQVNLTDDVAWIHLVLPVTRQMTPTDVEFRVMTDYGSWDRLPLRALRYFGFSPGDPEACCIRGITVYPDPGNRNVRASIELGGQKTGQELPVGWGQFQDLRQGQDGATDWGPVEVQWNEVYDLAAREGISRPILHAFLFVDGGQPVAKTRIVGHWNNTLLAFSYGNSNGAFVRHVSDFQSDARVAVDADPVHASVGQGLRLSLNLDEPDRETAFAYLPITHAGGVVFTPRLGDASYTSPDGTKTVVADPPILEFSSLRGIWEFTVTSQTQVINGDLPLVWGTQYVPARLPWQQSG